MSKQPSNSRRFVNAAWSLLTFQLITSVGAVAVTGWAAFHVSNLSIAREEQAATPPGEQASIATPPAVSTEGQTATPGAEQKPHELPPVFTPPAQTAAPSPPACARVEGLFRVQANTGWCDTGIVLQQGQPVALRANGRWSNAGEPQYGPAGIQGYQYPETIVANADLASLVGRVGETGFAIGGATNFVSPAAGPLYLSINDTPGTFDDNQGAVDVYLAVPLLQ